MTLAVRRCALLAALLAAAGCGRETITVPTPPVTTPPVAGLAAGAVLAIVSGHSGAPVPQANVIVDGQGYVADSAGRVAVAAAARPGALVDITSPATLDRQTTVQTRQATTLSLWPRTTPSGIDEAFTMSIVYTASTLQGGPPGAERLRRLPAGTRTVVIVPSAEILADDSAALFHANAVATLNEGGRGAVTYALARERPATGVVFAASVRPEDPSCAERVRALTRLSLRTDEVVGGEIVFCSWDAARSATVAHEMGHTFGLRHSSDFRDLMFGTFVRGRREELSQREGDVMQLMLQRPAGNRFPDSDRDATGSVSIREDLVVCR